MTSRKTLLIMALLLAGAGWLWHEVTQRRDLVDAKSQLSSRLHRPGPTQDRRSQPARRSAVERKPLDWQAVANELRGGRSVGGLLELIGDMSAAELVSALEEIAKADLGKEDQDAVERLLAAALIAKDPEQGFTRFAVPERDDWDFFLGRLFKDWVTRDDDEALAWLQGHAAGGGHIFDRMISDPFFALLGTKPETSTAVLAVLPPENRLESLRSLEAGSLRENGQQEWATLLRENLPPEDRIEAIAWPLGNWSDGDGRPMRLDEVDAYLSKIGASEEEWNACVMRVAEQPHSWKAERLDPAEGREALERMLSWVERHAPEMLESATIRAMAALATNGKFNEASTLALEFHEQSGNDAYLTGLLDQVDDLSDAGTVREMVGSLTDPDLQAKYREQLRRELE